MIGVAAVDAGLLTKRDVDRVQRALRPAVTKTSKRPARLPLTPPASADTPTLDEVSRPPFSPMRYVHDPMLVASSAETSTKGAPPALPTPPESPEKDATDATDHAPFPLVWAELPECARVFEFGDLGDGAVV